MKASAMKKIVGVFLALLCVGCWGEKQEAKKEKRFLYFSSDFPPNVYWDVIVEYKSMTDNIICKQLNFGSGHLEPATKNELFLLKKSGDTIKAPLFWDRLSLCTWEFQEVFLQNRVTDGQCLSISSASLGTTEGYEDEAPMPSVVDLRCKLDTANGCIDCRDTSKMALLFFNMPEESINAIHIKVHKD